MPRDQVGALRQQPEAAGQDPRDAAMEQMREALRDMLNGWQYIRSFHGDLYGVGWDRAQDKAVAAMALPRFGRPGAHVYRSFEHWATEHMPFALEKHELGDDGARLATACARLAFAAGRVTLPEPQSTASGSHQEARSNEQGEST